MDETASFPSGPASMNSNARNAQPNTAARPPRLLAALVPALLERASANIQSYTPYDSISADTTASESANSLWTDSLIFGGSILLGAVLLVPIALSGKLGHSSPLTRAKPALAARTAATHPVAAHPAAPEEAPPAATCGESPDPDCPLQGWMKANAAAALDAKDFVRLERALRRLVKLAPAGYEGWERTALEGADAAKQGDFAAVRVACKACHNAHRADYRRDHRADPLR